MLPRRPREPRRPIAAAVTIHVLLAVYGVWGLTRPHSEIRLTTEPPGALVVIDDWFRGETPYVQKLSVGRHRISIRAAGFEAQTFDITLGPEPHQLQTRLRPRQPPWRASSER